MEAIEGGFARVASVPPTPRASTCPKEDVVRWPPFDRNESQNLEMGGLAKRPSPSSLPVPHSARLESSEKGNNGGFSEAKKGGLCDGQVDVVAKWPGALQCRQDRAERRERCRGQIVVIVQPWVFPVSRTQATARGGGHPYLSVGGYVVAEGGGPAKSGEGVSLFSIPRAGGLAGMQHGC